MLSSFLYEHAMVRKHVKLALRVKLGRNSSLEESITAMEKDRLLTTEKRKVVTGN